MTPTGPERGRSLGPAEAANLHWHDLLALLSTVFQLVRRNETRLRSFVEQGATGSVGELFSVTSRQYQSALDVAHLGIDTARMILALSHPQGPSTAPATALGDQIAAVFPHRDTVIDIESCLQEFVVDIPAAMQHMDEVMRRTGAPPDVADVMRLLLGRLRQPSANPGGPASTA